jgi:hypothetical protein
MGRGVNEKGKGALNMRQMNIVNTQKTRRVTIL